MAHSAVLPPGITIREARESDIPEMLKIVNAAFEEEAFFVNRPRTYHQQLEDHLRSGRFLLAHYGAELVASVYYELRGERGYIGMLAVSPARQKQGLGRAMMNVAENALRDAGCKVAEISVVSVRTELPPIYRKMGYDESGFAELPEELAKKLTMRVKLIKMEKWL